VRVGRVFVSYWNYKNRFCWSCVERTSHCNQNATRCSLLQHLWNFTKSRHQKFLLCWLSFT